MLIKYVVPEDGDEQSNPNVFSINNDQPTVSEIKKEFPLPGNYHLRFLKSINGFSVWLDIVNPSEIAPIHSGGIFLKVTRLTAPSSSQRPMQTSNCTSSIEQPISQPNKPPKPPVKQQSEKLLKFDDFNNDESTASNAKELSTAGGGGGSSKSSAPLIHVEVDDLLGMDSASSSSVAGRDHVKVSTDDLFGLQHLQPEQQQQQRQPMQGGGQNAVNPVMISSHQQQQGISRGVSPMGGVSMNPMGGGGSNHIVGGSPHSSMGNFQQQQQPMRGGPRGAPPAMMGAAYDPFTNIAGLNGSQQQQQQSSPYGNPVNGARGGPNTNNNRTTGNRGY